MDNVLVISHGKNDRIIEEINYQTSKFLDPDPAVDPDYIFDAQYKYITNRIKQKFDHIIMAASPIALQLSKIILNENKSVIDGELDKQLSNNIRALLNENGHLYAQSPFRFNDDPNNQLYIDKLYKFGFICESITKFSIYKDNQYLKLKKVALPTKTERFNYLTEQLNEVSLIKIKYYSHVFDMEVSMKFDSPNFNNILPYKNLDEDDENFVSDDARYSAEDLIKLFYQLDDDTKVTLR